MIAPATPTVPERRLRTSARTTRTATTIRSSQPSGEGVRARPRRWVRSVPNRRFVKFDRPTKSTSILPFWKTSLPNASVSDAKSGKIERN
jgi:hypothetical protein